MLRQQKNFEHILDQLCDGKITKEYALELMMELIDAEIANNYVPITIPYYPSPPTYTISSTTPTYQSETHNSTYQSETNNSIYS